MHYISEHQFGPIESLRMGVGYFGRPALQVYSFLIDGLLIDSGPPKLKKELLSWLKNKPLEQVFITHHHEDHSGNVNEIISKYNVPIYGSKRCSQLVQGHVGSSLPQKIFWGKPDVIRGIIPYNSKFLETAQYRFELIPIPGHAEDQYALFEPTHGWMFSADAFVSPVIKFFMTQESMAEQIESIKNLLKRDFKWLLCAHRPLTDQGRKQLEQKLSFLQTFYEQVIYFHRQGLTARQILKAMGKKEFWGQYFLTLGKMSAINMVKSVLRDQERLG